jgi:ABC-type transport system involved in multi-copper enzyme maturation permease subunit
MMKNLVRAEARKLLSIRTAKVLPAAVIAISALAFLPAWTASEAQKATFTATDLLGGVRGSAFLVGLVAIVLGVLSTAGELRHGTMATTLLVNPHRPRLVAAKMATVAAVMAGTAVVANLGAIGLGTLVLRGAGVDGPLVTTDVLVTAAAVIGVGVVYAVAGVGLGLVVRDQTAAIVGALLWATVVENVLPVVLRMPELSRWMPGGAVRSLVTTATPDPGLLGPGAAALLLGAVVVVLVAGGVAAFRRLDVA